MKKISILIVDDSELDCYLLERELKNTEYDCTIFTKRNGLEALEFFKQDMENKAKLNGDFPPLVMFLDINMPLMDGLEFLQNYQDLRENKELGTTVVMMFTSSKNPKDIESSLEYDFVNGYLVKGEYSTSDLESVFAKVLN